MSHKKLVITITLNGYMSNVDDIAQALKAVSNANHDVDSTYEEKEV